ncbi:endonuclease/exonuclease/phosphatase family protein [Roseomonas sp. CCTCC AB2023176]|uniref:endonuclease/exonuclease/phosphatase family protein n=1 Tax=Roseomonas sp. CCTCC AB2023176 TaxID=3342640 RepID=UPI0035DD7C8D
MRVATWNIHRRRAVAGVYRPEWVEAVIGEIRPDVMALQEAQHFFRRDKGMLDEEAIARDLGLRPLRLPHRAGEQGWRSNVVLVCRDARVIHGPYGLRLGGLEPRGAVLAEIDLGDGPFRIVAAHLSLGARRRRLQGEALMAALSTGAGHTLPTLVMGDFNEWRPRGSVLGVLAPVFGEPPAAPTFPTFRPTFSLDRILGHPRGLVPRVHVHDTPMARRASDHLPLVARVEAGMLGLPLAA